MAPSCFSKPSQMFPVALPQAVTFLSSLSSSLDPLCTRLLCASVLLFSALVSFSLLHLSFLVLLRIPRCSFFLEALPDRFAPLSIHPWCWDLFTHLAHICLVAVVGPCISSLPLCGGSSRAGTVLSLPCTPHSPQQSL